MVGSARARRLRPAALAAACVIAAAMFLAGYLADAHRSRESVLQQTDPQPREAPSPLDPTGMRQIPPLEMEEEPSGRSEVPRSTAGGEHAGEQEPALYGTVSDGAGVGIQGALVVTQHDAKVRAVTGPSGDFELDPGNGKNRARVTVTHVGHAPAYADMERGREERITLTAGVLVRGRLLRERLAGEAEPIAHKAFVVNIVEPFSGPPVTTVTDAGGAFEFCERANSKVAATVELDGRADWSDTIVLGTETIDHDLVVPLPSVNVDVYVTDKNTGQPLADVDIRCQQQSMGMTSRNGRMSFAANGGFKYAIRAILEQYCTGRGTIITPSLGSCSISLALTPSASLFGNVFDFQGQPVTGAAVGLLVMASGDHPGVDYTIEGAATGTSTQTDSRGAFSFSGLGSGDGTSRVKIRIDHAECARFESDLIEVPNGESRGPIDCHLTLGARINGRVIANATGARATVRLSGPGQRERHTGDNGYYEVLNVPPGRWAVRAFLEGTEQISAENIVYVAEGDRTSCDFVLDYSAENIRGNVVAEDGLPVANVRLICTMPTKYDTEAHYVCTTDADGGFALMVPWSQKLDGLSYSLKLLRWDNDCAMTEVRPPMQLTMVCSPGGAVLFAPVDADTGELLQSVVVWWVDGGESRRLALYSEKLADGVVRVNVPVGKGGLRIDASGYALWAGSVEVVSGGTLNVGMVRLSKE